MAENINTSWKTGDYAMGLTCPVLIERVEGPLRVRLISWAPKGAGVYCGGTCMGGRAAEELKPITDPKAWMVVEVFDAQERIAAAQKIIEQETARRDKNLNALRAFEDAKDAVAAESVRGAA